MVVILSGPHGILLDVVQAVGSFFISGYILPNLNCSFVTLIPKTQGADSISQFRLIAMTNFMFKVITKILADLLAPIAARIIFPNQFAFLKGRHISDCILLASECINLLDNKCYGGNVAIKFDVAKAFDTLSWDFLTRVLQVFGFHSSFVQWISSILHLARLSILFNGSPVGFSVAVMVFVRVIHFRLFFSVLLKKFLVEVFLNWCIQVAFILSLFPVVFKLHLMFYTLMIS